MSEKEFEEMQYDLDVESHLLDPTRLTEQKNRVIGSGHEPSEAKMLAEKTGDREFEE